MGPAPNPRRDARAVAAADDDGGAAEPAPEAAPTIGSGSETGDVIGSSPLHDLNDLHAALPADDAQGLTDDLVKQRHHQRLAWQVRPAKLRRH